MHVSDWSGGLDCAPLPYPGRHILLVVHDQRLRYALADLLLDAGWSLTLANNGEIASMLIESAPGVDVLIADRTAPGVDGEALARLAPAIPAVFLPNGHDQENRLAQSVSRMVESLAPLGQVL